MLETDLSHSDEMTPRKKRFDRFFLYTKKLPESDSFLLKIAIIGCFISLIWLGITLSTKTQLSIPTRGGTLTEGILGTPRFVNPILAVTRADKDLTALLYDGIMRLGGDGTLQPSIAESITISDDGLTYNVILRRDITFHDKTPLTALDVVYTVSRIQDPSLGSPLRANFDNITVEQVGEYELNFILPEPYAPFIENLTFGILPEHIWKNVSSEEFPFSQRNSDPIGSGPYQVSKIARTNSGIPESYTLTPFPNYHGGTAKIETLTVLFFANEDTLVESFKKGTVDSLAGIDQSRLFELGIQTNTHTIMRIPLPRTFALFINQNKTPALRDPGARKALDVAFNRTTLIDTTLGGYGIPIQSPIPVGFGIDTSPLSTSTDSAALDTARDILKNAGWKLNTESGIWEKTIDTTVVPLSFSIATVNSPVFEATAEFLRATWEKLGAKVTIKQFEQSDLTQAIIRPRDYETLLFGTHVGRSLDFYSFWHSSQRNDPGLNVSLYTNITTDSILTSARSDTNAQNRTEALIKFAEEVRKETPALFLYEPELLYVFPNNVMHASFVGISEPHERFAGVHNWYMNTESVWPFFAKRNSNK